MNKGCLECGNQYTGVHFPGCKFYQGVGQSFQQAHAEIDEEKEKLYQELFELNDKLRKENGTLEVKIQSLEKERDGALSLVRQYELVIDREDMAIVRDVQSLETQNALLKENAESLSKEVERMLKTALDIVYDDVPHQYQERIVKYLKSMKESQNVG